MGKEAGDGPFKKKVKLILISIQILRLILLNFANSLSLTMALLAEYWLLQLCHLQTMTERSVYDSNKGPHSGQNSEAQKHFASFHQKFHSKRK